MFDTNQTRFDTLTFPFVSSSPPPSSSSSLTCAKTIATRFDACYSEDATQDEIFNNEVKPLLSMPLKGFNATCFAYGPTGAGKTHTMQGTKKDPGTCRMKREPAAADDDFHLVVAAVVPFPLLLLLLPASLILF